MFINIILWFLGIEAYPSSLIRKNRRSGILSPVGHEEETVDPNVGLLFLQFLNEVHRIVTWGAHAVVAANMWRLVTPTEDAQNA